MRAIIQRLDLGRTWPQWTLLLIGLVAAILLRYANREFFTTDHTVHYIPWVEHLRANGFHGLATIDANYNPPFLYLLLIGAHTPLDAVSITKVIACTFDLASAIGIAFILWHFWRRPLPAAAGGIAYLFAPEVWLNSSMWGQVDSVHTAFLIWAAWAILTRRHLLVWILFALGLSFKLQTVFLLPLVGIAFILQKHRWWQPLVGVGAYLLTLVPALIAGRPANLVFGVYFSQANGTDALQMNAVTIYQWFSENVHAELAAAGVYFGIGIVAILGFIYLRRNPGWLQIAAVFGIVVPFVLPSMHDRYFYAGSAFVLILAALDRRYLPAAITLQFTAIIAYGPFVGNDTFALPLPFIAAVQLAAIVWVVWLTISPHLPTIGDDDPDVLDGMGRLAELRALEDEVPEVRP